jgi:EmrB/QacA subfamily drug resistance transporter
MTDSSARRAALVAVTLISFATPFMISGVNIALPMIGSEFGASAILLSWLSTSYTLATAVVLLPFGKLADIQGRKRVFLTGTWLYTVASFLCALVGSTGMLIATRVIQGIGAAMIFATSAAILTSIYPPNERGKALGINVAAVYLGMSVGPFLGGVMVEALGWRSVFWANVPLGLLTAALAATRMRGEWTGSPGDPFDLAGSAVYALAVVALMMGFSQLPAMRGVWLVLAGVAAGAAFLTREGRIPHPVLDLRLLRGNRVFTLSSLAALINYAATASVTFLLSLYLQYIKALSPREAGVVLIAQPLMQAIFSPLAGRLSDRVEPRIVASTGMAFTAAGLVMLTFLGDGTSLAYVVACLLVLGFGFGLFSSPNTSAIMGAVERRHYGVASGLVGTMRVFGQMLSMGTAMILFALYIGQVQITPEYYGRFMASARTAFAISAVLCAMGILASLARGRARVAEGAEVARAH